MQKGGEGQSIPGDVTATASLERKSPKTQGVSTGSRPVALTCFNGRRLRDQNGSEKPAPL